LMAAIGEHLKNLK